MGWTSEGSEFESPCIVKSFLFSVLSRLILWLTKPPIQQILGALPSGVRLSSVEVKKMYMYLHSLIYPHGIMLN